MLTVSEALERVLADVPLQPTQTLPVTEALGRVLAEPLIGSLDVPPWDNSAMDGYAVRAADTAEGEVSLSLLEVIGAGAMPTRVIEPGTASAIMTGAPVPEGADAIVMVERSDGAQQGQVRLSGKAQIGDHIRRRGEDIRVGDLLLQAGERLGPAALGLAHSQGLTHATVRRRPTVAILSTGDEVVTPGEPLQPGQIYSSNNVALAGLVTQAGARPLDRGHVRDDLDAIVEALRNCIDSADVVLTTGGVSVGEFDLVKQAYQVLGVPMDFWRVQMKPGKPLAFGVIDTGGRRVPVFGLPGNPVSCMVNFLQFVRPWLLRSMGCSAPFLPIVRATALEDLRIHAGRLTLSRVVVDLTEQGFTVRSTGTQSSGALTSMARATGLAILGPDNEGVRAGEDVRVQLIDTDFLGRSDSGLP